MERSVRTLVSIILVVAALFVAMDRIVASARIEDWWLVVVLLALALLVYLWQGRSGGVIRSDITDASAETALEGYRRAVAPSTPIAAAVVIPAKVPTEAQATHNAIVEAYDGIRDTDVRSDVMASVTTIDTQEARAVGGRVENIMDSGATGTFEEVDEIAGGPVESISKAEAKPAAAPKAASGKKAAAAAKADDLTVIEGIGPKMSTALVKAGIDTYAKLSASSEDQLRAAVEAAGMRLAPSLPTWAEQAALADKGDTAGLKKLQSKIKGGRKK